MNRFLSGLAALAAVVSAPAATTFEDGTFSDSDWSASFSDYGPAASFSAGRQTTGGNPGDFRTISHSYGGNGGITVYHVWSAAGWNPSSDGAITMLDFSFDARYFDPGQSGTVAFGALVEQDGVIYTSGNVLTTSAWQNFMLPELVSESFIGVGGRGIPDFSATGGAIRFGFYSANGTGGSSPTSTISGLDNFAVTITAVPEPGATPLLAAGAAIVVFGGGRLARRKLAVMS